LQNNTTNVKTIMLIQLEHKSYERVRARAHLNMGTCPQHLKRGRCTDKVLPGFPLTDNSIFKFAADIRIDPSDLLIDDGTRFFGEPAGTPTMRRVPKLSYISQHARNLRPPNRCRALAVSEYWGNFVKVSHQTGQYRYALRSEVRLKPILQAQPKTPRANLVFRSQLATGQDYIYLRAPAWPKSFGVLAMRCTVRKVSPLPSVPCIIPQ
jgi:hypothetical protein